MVTKSRISRDSFIYHHLEEELLWISLCEERKESPIQFAARQRQQRLEVIEKRADDAFNHLLGSTTLETFVTLYNSHSYPGMFSVPLLPTSRWLQFDLKTKRQVFENSTSDNFQAELRREFSKREYTQNRRECLSHLAFEYHHFAMLFPNYAKILQDVMSLFPRYAQTVADNLFEESRE